MCDYCNDKLIDNLKEYISLFLNQLSGILWYNLVQKRNFLRIKFSTKLSIVAKSRHWYEGFRKRHPELSIRKPQHLSISRAAVNREELQEWFKDSGKYLESKNLLNIPASRIFNCDESSILLCPDAESVLAEKGSHAVYKIVDGGKEALTVLFTYRADGTLLKFTLDSMKNEKSAVVSGFRGAGLYPFNSNAVDYDILQKTKKSKKTVDRLDNNSADENGEN
ncbi:Protein of unknown function [Cotesia congregata]|uniref:HTH CENPB-type domain-containing protein n=1 Tax=Cotesia congregata TaxID=51543 RepID=A0A8J2HEU4_COTCN|nr:Protein of unknown function [Cotesia congregata]